jgi:uncharacterized protein
MISSVTRRMPAEAAKRLLPSCPSASPGAGYRSIKDHQANTPAPRHSAPPPTSQDLAELARGADLFNSGQYWHAHEAWEAIWLRRRHSPDPLFFKGLIQLAAAHHQRINGRYAGFLIHLDRAQAKLAPYRPQFFGVNVESLLASIEACRLEALRLGEEGLRQFDQRLIPTLR